MSNDLIPSIDEFAAIEKITKHAYDSKYFEKLGGISGIFSIIMYAKELGIHPMQALFGGMQNVLGKIQVAPVQMNAMIRRAGHRIDIIECTDKLCTLKGTRAGTDETATVTYTIEMARKAGNVKAGGGYEKYAEDMLWARAMSRLARRLFPDVIGPMYVEGEIDEEDGKKKKSKKTLEIEEIPDVEEPIAPEPEVVITESHVKDVMDITGITEANLVFDYMKWGCKEYGTTPEIIIPKWKEDPVKLVKNYRTWLQKVGS
jgi:hypothetical protein